MALTTNLQKVEALYVAYYGRAGDPAGVTYWVNQMNSGKSFADLAGYFATQTESKVAYPYLVNPTLVDPTSFVTQIYTNLFARAPDAPGLAYWVGQLTANQGNAAFVAQFINYVVGGAAPADVAVLDNKVVAATYFTQVMATTGNSLTGPDGQLTPAGSAEAKAATANVNGDAASVQASKDATDAIVPPGVNVNLTTGTDNIIGSGGSDIITAGALAADGVTPATTLNVLDTINGGGGVDTLVVDTTGNQNQTIQGTITNVENLTIVGNGTTINNVVATPFSGTIAFKGTSDTTIGVSEVTGQTIVLDGTIGATTVTIAAAAAQASLSLKASANADNAAFAVSGAALKTVNLAVDKTVAGKSVSVDDNNGVADTVENVNIAASAATTVSVTSGALKAVTVTGAGAVALTAAAANSIDASGSTGGVTLAGTLAAAATFTGGAGKDSVTLDASTKAIAMGAGDDTVTWTTAALGTGGTVDGGEGVDTIVLTAANAATATSTAPLGKAFADSIQNFEKFGIGATAAGTTVNAQYLDGITHIISAGGANLLTINNLAANSTVELTANNASGTVLSLADATGTADVLNLKLVGAAGFNTGAISATGVETLNITTLDTDGAATAFTSGIAASAAKSVVISGNAGIDVTSSLAGTAITSFDASGVTGTGAAGAVKYTSGALAADATVKGGAGDDALNLGAALKSVTVDGGAGNDTITTGVGADTIVGGAGNDIISSGTGLDIITGGAGNDTFNLVANTNGNIYATITDATAGDILSFTDLGTATFLTKGKVTLAETAVFQDYLNAASVADGSTNANFGWFQWGGNTYVVNDHSDVATFVNGTDIVVKLSGLVDVSTATLGDHSLTLV